MPLLAPLPILLILLLMVGLRWNAVKAGLAGYTSALLIALFFFNADWQILATAHLKALTLSLDVLAIIWSAYFLYRVSDEAGAIATIGESLRQLTSDKGLQAILIGWVFASFLQGTGGFGVPVAVTAPLLVGLGFSPLTAVVIPTVGHGWAVTFGSLGSSFNALISATGLPAAYLAPAAAIFLGLSAIPTGLMVLYIAQKETRHAETRKVLTESKSNCDDTGGRTSFPTEIKMKPFESTYAETRKVLRESKSNRDDTGGRTSFPTKIKMKPFGSIIWQVILIGAVMGLVQYLVAVVLGMWTIGSFAGGMAGLAVGIVIARWGQASSKHARNDNSDLTLPPLGGAGGGLGKLIPFSAYISLIFYTVLSLFIPKSLFTHPGAILFYSALTAFFIYRRAGLYEAGMGKRIVSQTGRKMLKSSLSIALMVAMAMIMQKSGMTEALARGLADGVGRAYPFAVPWIGALGAFMTGSNTNSNVIFAGLQLRTAELLGYSVPIILAGQTAGASLASVIAPAKLIVGASTAGMESKEGEVMRAMIGYSVALVLFISFLTVLAIFLRAIFGI